MFIFFRRQVSLKPDSLGYLRFIESTPAAVTASSMPPQIKHDVNRSGWETTDFPSVCEQCLPDNPYVQMLKEDYGAECKICTRPMTVFRWKADRTARTKRSNICLTCARLKNCCQCCMLDLSFGLPIVVRDAALKMVAPGPTSAVNREYYAQEHEKEIEEGRGAVEEYEKTDEKARDLLRRLANSEPYHRRQLTDGDATSTGPPAYGPRRITDDGDDEAEQPRKPAYGPGPRPVRNVRPRARGGRGPFPGAGQIPSLQDWKPPADKHISSLFVTGVEDDLPEYALRAFFAPFGTIRSLICSHRAHCAFVNYVERPAAEKAAEHCRGRAVVQGCPLRVQWGKPKPLDNLDNEERMKNARAGRAAVASGNTKTVAGTAPGQKTIEGAGAQEEQKSYAVAPPPGSRPVEYASLAGD